MNGHCLLNVEFPGYSVPILVEICPVVLEQKIFKFRQCFFFAISWLSHLAKGRGSSFEQTWIPFVPSWIEIGPVAQEKMKMWKDYRQTTDDRRSEKLTWTKNLSLLARLLWLEKIKVSDKQILLPFNKNDYVSIWANIFERKDWLIIQCLTPYRQYFNRMTVVEQKVEQQNTQNSVNHKQNLCQ